MCMKPQLDKKTFLAEAKKFCEIMAKEDHKTLIGITDGKAVGTYIEHKFQTYLDSKYTIEIGNSAKGIDFPSPSLNTDLKVTSVTQPQSSCPFKNARQKIFGLGYNLLVFVYNKKDTKTSCKLDFEYRTFIEADRTADYTTSKRLLEMLKDGANEEDIISYLEDRNVPGDEFVYGKLAKEIISNPPKQGYLTISNALQWRLQYSRVISLNNTVSGVTNYVW